MRIFPLGSRGTDRPLAVIERRFGRMLPFAILLGLVASGLEALSIALFVRLTLVLLSPATAVQSSPMMGIVSRITDAVMPGKPIIGLSLLVLALVTCKSLTQIANARFMAAIEGAAGRDIRDMLARKVLNLDFGFFLKNDTARLVTIVDTESWLATDAVRTIFNIAAGSAAVTMFTALLFLAEWRLSLVVLAGVALSRLVQWLMSRQVAHRARAAVASNQLLGEQMMQIVRAIRVIRLFGQEPNEERRFEALSEDVRSTMLRTASRGSATMPVIEIILSALILIVLLTAGSLAVPLTTTAAFLVLLYRVQSPLMMVGHGLVHLASLRGSIEQVEWLLDQPEAADDADRGAPVFADRTITFDAVDYAYPSQPGERVLEGLSFAVPPGSITALVGRSGAGKSTIVNLLCRLVAPSAGAIRLDGIDAARFDPRHWRDQIALAGQDIDMVSGSVRDNIAYGYADATDADVEEAARSADAHGFIAQLPHGYDTRLGALGFGLSGGQRQRIGLARALIRRPEVLILDEATSAVDGLSERTIMDLLQQHRRFGRAIVISHRRTTLAMCDRGIVIEDGRIVETGPLRLLDWYRTERAASDAGDLEETGEMIARIRAMAKRLLHVAPFGAFDRATPISAEFGFDRGLPVDRYYIETFLSENAGDISGRTLEVGDDAYSRQFGGDRADPRETIHIDPAEPATFHGDITQPGILPDAAFDCIVFTQTLHLIYDMPLAIARLHDALKPGGVLLVTVPGITPIAGDRWGENWFWSLTPASLRRLCDATFGTGAAQIGCYGNVFAATAFLYGLAMHEVAADRLDAVDPRYPVIVTARVRRPIVQPSN